MISRDKNKRTKRWIPTRVVTSQDIHPGGNNTPSEIMRGVLR